MTRWCFWKSTLMVIGDGLGANQGLHRGQKRCWPPGPAWGEETECGGQSCRDLGRTVSETGEGEAGVMSDPKTGMWPRHFNDRVLVTSTGNPVRTRLGGWI